MSAVTKYLNIGVSYILTLILMLNVFLFGGKAKPLPENCSNRVKAEAVYDAIMKRCYNKITNNYYNNSLNSKRKENRGEAYLWPFSSVFDGLICLNFLHNGSYNLKIEKILECLEGYYDKNRDPKFGYDSSIIKTGGGDRYYDDNMWIGLAFCKLYEQTGEERFLKKAKQIYKFCMTGYDDKLGGGIYWKEPEKNSKHACSNGPQIVFALSLYLLTGKTENKYLRSALNLYDWMNNNLRSPNNVYWDNIRVSDGYIDKTTWTYNTGTMLHSNVLLYRITGDIKYLNDAELIAESSLNHFAINGDFPDSKWFNAVLLRGYAELYKENNNDKYLLAIEHFADKIWKEQRDENTNLFSRDNENWELLQQGAMLEIYATLANILN